MAKRFIPSPEQRPADKAAWVAFLADKRAECAAELKAAQDAFKLAGNIKPLMRELSEIDGAIAVMAQMP